MTGLERKEVFSGEWPCRATLKTRNAPCGNKAYFLACDGQLLCGTHAKRDKSATPLLKNPNKSSFTALKFRQERAAIEAAAMENLRAGRRGALIVTKMRMLKAPEDHPGFMKVFPNNKHGGRRDGLGLPSLSPMRLGPVAHGQPHLPPAMSIEKLFEQKHEHII